MNEASKVRQRILPLLEGKTVIDLGCGDEKIVPWALGVDTGHEWGECPRSVDLRTPINPAVGERDAELLKTVLVLKGHPTAYDVVFSSHALEHMREPVGEVLRHWAALMAPGGRLVLYLPNEARYQFDPSNPRRRNPAHLHYLVPEVVRMHVEQLHGFEIERWEEDPFEPDLYSVLVVCRRVE